MGYDYNFVGITDYQKMFHFHQRNSGLKFQFTTNWPCLHAFYVPFVAHQLTAFSRNANGWNLGNAQTQQNTTSEWHGI